MEDQLHRFGSEHTRIKLNALGKYLPAYTTALSKTPFTLHYFDAFAGSGVCHIKVAGRRLMVPGSASIAIGCTPPFHKMTFIELSRRRAAALARLKDAAPHRDITIIQGEANTTLPALLEELNPRTERAIVFLDPYGMEVEWSTLKKIAASKITDLWYLFPLSGVYRQATKDVADIDEHKAAALNRILGTAEWRTAFYTTRVDRDLFDERSREERASIPEMLDWVKRRHETIFPGVAKPKMLYQENGAPAFALFFMVSNPSTKAKQLALRIAEGVLSSDR